MILKLFENDTILSVIPLSFIISPAAIKKGIANKVNESTPEYILVTIALKGKSPKKLSASIDEKPIAKATGKLMNNSKKKAVNKIFSEGAVFFAHGFNKLRKRFHVREFETISKKKMKSYLSMTKD